MGWALAVIHPCSWRSNSSGISRFDWRRNKGHANGTPCSTVHNAQCSLRLASLATPVRV